MANRSCFLRFQRRWGIDQWAAYVEDKEVQVLLETRDRLAMLREEKEDRLAPKDLAVVVFSDPFLALKLLRRVEGRHSAMLEHETTTALASVLQAESGELLLWHVAPELPQKALDELHSGRALRSVQAQQHAVDFSFKQMTLTLVETWALPRLIAMLIRGSDTLRANIARVAEDTARHIGTHQENPAIPADLVNIKNLIPGVSYQSLPAPLPISDEYKELVLQAVDSDNYSRGAG